MQVKTQAVMIMGCSSNLAKNGNTYYNVDVYDSISGELYRCSCDADTYQKIASINKPAPVKSLHIDLGRPYQGACRLSIVGWE